MRLVQVFNLLPLLLVSAITGASACTIPPGMKDDSGTVKSAYVLAVLGKELTCAPDWDSSQRYSFYGSPVYMYLCEGTTIEMRPDQNSLGYYNYLIRDKAGNLFVGSQIPLERTKPVTTDICDTAVRTRTTIHTIKAAGSTPLEFVFTEVTTNKVIPFTPTF